MSFKVLHRGYQHIRLSSSFSLTLDIQDYLRSLAKDEKGDRLYSVLYGSAALYSTYERRLLCIRKCRGLFKKKLTRGKVSDLMTLPIRREESAYSIVSGAAIKRFAVFEVFVPYPYFVIFGLVIRLWVMSKKPIKL